ncbi:bifunctional helix-turn-helix transcriptional regulator/GNAT family N-acetyltransferase [Paraoerskovia marina]|uniref:bifunctional helix-turn-helix transcriptional regulator/GNAT family N-acetyltransferase n=1 Tax=Paraoerskovia marina TaxID=545619 RepID=UPI000492B973|nr:helix-turn-helix domain-containing GNAT family N-acetyltransferase [Paraoerskovia marina]
MHEIDDDQTAVLRRFNRSYTQRIGALDDSFLGSGMPLGTARVLYEIGTGVDMVAALRARLDLDSGYVSRMLRRLESDDLVVVAQDPADRRRRTVALTSGGQERWDAIEASSGRRAAGLMEPLSPRQRERLTAALREADLLVRAATVDLRPVDPEDPRAVVAVGAYVDELNRRFSEGFDAARATREDAVSLRPPRGVFLVAVSDGDPVACGAVRTIGPGVAEIKRMWVDATWRGAGLGSRMLRRLEEEAARLGDSVVRLDTRGELSEAVALYERAGYRPVERYNDNPDAGLFYEKAL